jgi:hypothetical protein
VSTLSTAPNPYGLACNLAVVTNGASVFCILLCKSASCISSNANTVSCAKSCCCLCFLGSLCQSVPLLICYHFSQFTALLFGDR